MDILDVILIITGLLEIGLGLLIFLRNKNSQINLSFASLNFTLGSWSLFMDFFRMSNDPTSALIWIKAAYISGALIASSLLYFANVFLEAKSLSSKKKLFILIPSILHTILLIIPNYLHREIIFYDWGKDVILGTTEYLIYSIYFLSFFYGAIYVLWKKYKKNIGFLRSQIQFIMIGMVLASIAGVIFDLILPWLRIYRYIYFGPPFVIIIFQMVAYSIVRHKLMDIRLVIARTVSFSLLILFVTLVYALISVFALSLFTGLKWDNKVFATSASLLVIMAFTVQPMRRRIEKLTDRIFFKDRYDMGKLLYALALKMASTIKLDELMHELLRVLFSQMRVNRGALILAKDHTVGQVAHAGYNVKPEFDNNKIISLFSENKTLVFEDLAEGSLKEFMRLQGFIVVVPLRSEEKNIGLLVMGEKLSGDRYADSDIQVLETFAKEAVVAIENARAYEEIRRFNITLRDKVDIATKELKELARQQKDQMDVIGHEARTPLTTISQELNLILTMILPEEKRKEWQNGNVKREDARRVIEGLTTMNIATKQEASIINNMVEAARIDKQTFELNYSTFDLIGLIQLAINESKGRLASNNKQASIIFQPDLRTLEVEADKTRIKQCIDGLLTNAEKYGINPQSNSLDINITLKTEKGKATISIQDSGIGIDPCDMEKLGKKFSRLNPYAKGSKLARPGGTGLGLYTFKGIMEKHRGQLIIESGGVGKGSTFTIVLPVLRAN